MAMYFGSSGGTAYAATVFGVGFADDGAVVTATVVGPTLG